jgi:myo-inositol-1-phosphate synthase
VSQIRVAIAGVGNCASALIQGLEHYRRDPQSPGLLHPSVGGYGPDSIQVVAAFDVDRRKVGRPLNEAVLAQPNCATVFQPELPETDVVVALGPQLDGVAPHMADHDEARAFRPAEGTPVDVADALRSSGAEILLCYLPVGSVRAVHHYVEACLKAGVALVNCIPVPVAADPALEARFRERGLPIVGDDVKSQFGATILHRMLMRTLCERGLVPERTYQLNVGGNTDFLNMLDRSRLAEKKTSKTESVQSQLDERLPSTQIHVGPSDYVAWQEDTKVAFLRVEARGFGNQPVQLEVRLNVEDSPNSGGVVIDAIRYAKLALDRGQVGALLGPSAATMKSPPLQLRDADMAEVLAAFIEEGRDVSRPQLDA